MTASIQATTTPRGEGTASARTAPAKAAGAPATRSFDRVFGEAIDERPERPEVEDERGAEARDGRERAETADEDGGGDGGAKVHDESSRPEAGETLAEPEEQDADEAEVVVPELARPAKPKARVSADGIRHEITHAADVDVASLNARELSTRGAKSELAEAPEPRASVPEPANAGERAGRERGERATSGSSPRQTRGETPTTAGEPIRARTSAPTPTPASAAAPSAAPGAASAAGSANAAHANSPTPASAGPGSATPAVAAAVTGVSAASGSSGSNGSGSNAAGEPNVLTRLTTLGVRAPTPKASSPSARHPALAQVQRGLAQVLKEGGGTVTLRLNPRSLGEVRVEVTVKEGAASARFEASSESARRLLKDNLTTLREALEAKGVRVERLSVELRPGEKPTESADGHRTGRDAGPSQRGDGSPEGFDARSETGAEGGARGDARDARWTASAGTRAGGPQDAERQSDEGPVPDRSGTDRGVWVGLDMVA